MLFSTRLVLLTLWLGAAIFFSVVVAPAAFGALRSFDLSNSNEIAGTIVNRTLSVINISGFIVGSFLLITFFVRPYKLSRVGSLVELVCIGLLVTATAVGHWFIAARMRALRTAMTIPIDQVALDDPRHLAFTSLHGYSVKALGLAMIAGLIGMVLLVRSRRG